MEEIERMKAEVEKGGKPKYEPPKVVTYAGDDLLQEMGPAQACYVSPCPFP